MGWKCGDGEDEVEQNKRKKWYELKNFAKAGIALGLFLGAALVTYALTQYFTTGEFKITPTPDHYFEIVVSGGEQPVSIGPGKSFTTQPTIENYATEEMYVFMRVSDGGLYEFVVGDGWVEIEDGVYAYGGEEMTVLSPGETTPALTSEMKMREIYDLMNWDKTKRYKIIGFKIEAEGDELFIFDLNMTECFDVTRKKKKSLEKATESEVEEKKSAESKEEEKPLARFSEKIRTTYGVTIEEDEARKHISLGEFQEV